ncbi:Alcohol dehydrogenase, class IV [Rubellimicrobium thermophilum DSM 16684]|uniref:Alcohol dehydrogenase 2 n=1 Tax=Rubellimicrobium thermophilum DSM 16684 TaxID=1123069 RepID=S9RYY2_9RHOB|nr:iron-containing alcohol dehydrogenase [Rubellimicrobium thermophilum]EPX83225.1 Alcohol dehydrogenase, class IV [Rubellimicrobium thermophilum DSM 16684]
MQAFQFHTVPAIRFAEGAVEDLARLAAARLGPRILLVTDPGLRRLGLIDPARRQLETAGSHVTIFDAVEPDPAEATLHRAVAAGRQAAVTGVVGLGGGSSLDVAKLAALLLGSGEPLDEAWGVGRARGPRLPLVLIPTTAGTGSEVTPVAILTVGGEEKRGVSSPLLLPDLALLDPLLTLGLPGPVTAATGIDAMVHAIEAYASASPNNNPLSRALAREALRLLGGHIRQVMADGSDRAARGAMLLGAMLAGQAFANAPVAAVHALAYPLGGMFHLAHGLSNALVLPHVLRFNAPAAAAAYARIAPDAFPDLAAIAPEERRALAFADRLAGLCRDLGLPARLRDLDIPREALPRMARAAMQQTRLLVNNPRPVTEGDALAIYEAAW